jgi:hypothetical protein
MGEKAEVAWEALKDEVSSLAFATLPFNVAAEQVTGVDPFTKRPLVPKGASPTEEAGIRLARVAGQVAIPAEIRRGLQEMIEPPKDRPTVGPGRLIGITSAPPPRTMRKRMKRRERTEESARRRFLKKGGVGGWLRGAR